jgi:hypothetical protein
MKTDKDIEQLLMSGKKLSLSTHEKALIKSTLLEHATETFKHETPAVPSLWTSWMIRSSISFASLLIVFVGTAYASNDSLPGEPLYAMKVHVVEEMISLTKTNPEERVAYDIKLMENRLVEIKEIVRNNIDIAPENLAVLTDRIDEHVSDVTITLEETSSDQIPHEEKIKMLTKLSGVTKAQIKIAQKAPELTEMAKNIEKRQESASEAVTATIEKLVAHESVANVNEYLSDQITEVGEHVNASTTDEPTRDAVERHLHDVDKALIGKDTTKAIISILEAQQEISTEEYLNIEERTDNLPAEDIESNQE